jgi:hypothetical protein
MLTGELTNPHPRNPFFRFSHEKLIPASLGREELAVKKWVALILLPKLKESG